MERGNCQLEHRVGGGVGLVQGEVGIRVSQEQGKAQGRGRTGRVEGGVASCRVSLHFQSKQTDFPGKVPRQHNDENSAHLKESRA